MRKFGVISGFLGSGKTTTMMALTEHYTKKHGMAAMITNDLGGKGLADNKLAQLRGLNAVEITGDCICYQHEVLTRQLNELYDAGCELVISDIPGFGVGALEHVYHGLSEEYPGEYELAPFTVLIEPRTVGLLQKGGDEPAYILHTQLVEADLIVLNKSDLISDGERREMLAFLSSAYPQAKTICISALKGIGLEELALALKDGRASMQRPDIGYGGEDFNSAMGRVCEYYVQYFASVCCNSFDGNSYLRALAEEVRSALAKTAGALIPHMKFLAWTPEGEYGKADLLGTDRDIEVNQRFSHPCTQLAVVLNASAFCPGEELERLIMGAVEKISEEFMLDLIIYKKELVGQEEE